MFGLRKYWLLACLIRRMGESTKKGLRRRHFYTTLNRLGKYRFFRSVTLEFLKMDFFIGIYRGLYNIISKGTSSLTELCLSTSILLQCTNRRKTMVHINNKSKKKMGVIDYIDKAMLIDRALNAIVYLLYWYKKN